MNKLNINEIDFSSLLVPYHEEFLTNLSTFIAIDSTYDKLTSSKDDPFGIGVSKALNFIMKLAKQDGFKVKNYKNMVVEILIGEGTKNITIMAHADVVPAGEGWESNPFLLKKEDDIIYGRGVSDDKGPLLACYYALKALKENKLLGDYQVRFLVGGNEESGSLGMQYYFDVLKKKVPTYGFSPDADFPLIFAEKGLINFNINKTIILDDVESIDAGVAYNSVISRATLKIKHHDDFISLLNKEKVDYFLESSGEYDVIVFNGIPAHGATPEEGKNSGMILLEYLAKYYKNNELFDIVNKLTPLDGKGINCFNESTDMGHNSLNVGLITYKNNNLFIGVNFRHVDGVDVNELKDKIIHSIDNAEIKITSTADLLYYSKDSLLVKTLLDSYQKETGDYKTNILAIGGGTYAKETKNVVAFGAQFLDFDTFMHSNKERAKLSSLYLAMRIYARAILSLGVLIDEA
ncbi:MAG: Sapep family Mn(2+)-dependent dipeptidase [Bacilli bacterium]